jgi:hypothetical protein
MRYSDRDLSEANQLGWRIKIACLWAAPNPKSRHDRQRIQCDTTTDLDFKTLVWTCGAAFRIAMLESLAVPPLRQQACHRVV